MQACIRRHWQVLHSWRVELLQTWMPFQEAFDKAIEIAPATYWAGDRVHPSMAGAQLMAEVWLRALA